MIFHRGNRGPWLSNVCFESVLGIRQRAPPSTSPGRRSQKVERSLTEKACRKTDPNRARLYEWGLPKSTRLAMKIAFEIRCERRSQGSDHVAARLQFAVRVREILRNRFCHGLHRLQECCAEPCLRVSLATRGDWIRDAERGGAARRFFPVLYRVFAIAQLCGSGWARIAFVNSPGSDRLAGNVFPIRGRH